MSLSFKPPFIGEFSFLPRLITRGCVYGGGKSYGAYGAYGAWRWQPMVQGGQFDDVTMGHPRLGSDHK